MVIPLEHVACPLCGADVGKTVLESTDHYGYAPGRFVVQRCRNCGLCYQNPRPTAAAFAAIYPPDYGPYQGEAIEPQSIPPDLLHTCDLIARYQPAGGRLLDVGAGPGKFLRALTLLQPQWQTMGLEPGESAATMARSYGLTVHTSTLAAAELAPESWDAVTLWNVLEHLPDPLAELHHIRSLLRPDGLLYLTVPLCDSWDARIFGRFWLGWELPRHFTHFERASLTQLLARAGFSIRHTESLSGVESCVIESLRIALRSLELPYPTYRLAQALLCSRPARRLWWPYLALATWQRRTTVVTIVAQSQAK